TDIWQRAPAWSLSLGLKHFRYAPRDQFAYGVLPRRFDRLDAGTQRVAEIVGHHLDLVLREYAAAPHHAVDGRLPAAPVLAAVAEHRVGVALKAFARHHLLARTGHRLLRMR